MEITELMGSAYRSSALAQLADAARGAAQRIEAAEQALAVARADLERERTARAGVEAERDDARRAYAATVEQVADLTRERDEARAALAAVEEQARELVASLAVPLAPAQAAAALEAEMCAAQARQLAPADVDDEAEELRREVARLRTVVDQQSATLRALTEVEAPTGRGKVAKAEAERLAAVRELERVHQILRDSADASALADARAELAEEKEHRAEAEKELVVLRQRVEELEGLDESAVEAMHGMGADVGALAELAIGAGVDPLTVLAMVQGPARPVVQRVVLGSSASAAVDLASPELWREVA